jgi:hypothetical protein
MQVYKMAHPSSFQGLELIRNQPGEVDPRTTLS